MCGFNPIRFQLLSLFPGELEFSLRRASCSFVEKRLLALSISQNNYGRNFKMLTWALIFLLVALVAAALGFGGIAGASATFAQILFIVFIVLFLISLFVGGTRRPTV